MIAPLAGLLAAAAAPEAGMTRIDLAQFTVRQRVVIRVQTIQAAPPARTQWREKGGPKCVDMADIQGAAVVAPGSVDVILRRGARMRVRFAASCPALDYYSGFYIAPTRDGRICASRDVVRDRAGGECAVDRFRKLSLRR